jgi:RNA polymerase sigma-70 factor (ECF subfamily)
MKSINKVKEEEAINRLNRGDIGGLEMLVRAYQVKAVRAAYLVIQDKGLAEDVVQNAFLRIYDRIKQFDKNRAFSPWFFRIVMNDAVKAVRRNGREISWERQFEDGKFSLDELVAEDILGPSEEIERAELRKVVAEALEKLPPEQRAVVVMYYFLGMSEAEVVEEMAVPTGTVKWRLYAARRRLRKILANLQFEK